MRTIEIVLRGLGRERRKMEGVNLIKRYCQYLQKHHSVPLCNYNMLIIIIIF
jgi:hypothetical protein